MSIDKHSKLIIGLRLGQVIDKITSEEVQKPKLDEFTGEPIENKYNSFLIYYAFLNGEKIKIAIAKTRRNMPEFFRPKFELISKDGKYNDDDDIVRFGDLQIIKGGYESRDYLNDYYIGIEIDQSNENTTVSLKSIENKVQSELMKHFGTLPTPEIQIVEHWI